MSGVHGMVAAAHQDAVDALKKKPSYASPVPTSREVRVALKELGPSMSLETIIEACRELGLPLANMPAQSEDEITRKLPTSR